MSITEEQAGRRSAEATAALELRDLDVAYRVRGVDRQVLRGINLRVERGESVGLVGESGCGKSTAALAIVRYLPRNGKVRSGSVLVDGRDVWRLSARELRELRSGAVSMVYQNPGAALNPSIRIGRQVAEVFTVRGTPIARGAGARDRHAAQGADRRPRLGHAPLPASAVGRHAAARHHRDGAGDRSGAADPRRADHRARRDRRVGGARPRARPAQRVRHLDPLHQPQPRRDRLDVRPHRRAVRGRARRGGAVAAGAARSATPLHRRSPALHPAGGRAQGRGPPRHHSRLPPAAGCGHPRLCLRRSLCARAGHLRRGEAAAVRPRRPAVALPLPRQGAAAAP